MEDPRHGAWSGPPASLREWAEMLIKAIDNLPQTLANHLGAAKKPTRCPGSPSLWRDQYALYKVRWSEPFVRALNMLQSEIHALGRESETMLRLVAKAQTAADEVADAYLAKMVKAGGKPLFRDVPVGHWAWESIQDLRDAGIIHGYPGGDFEPQS